MKETLSNVEKEMKFFGSMYEVMRVVGNKADFANIESKVKDVL